MDQDREKARELFQEMTLGEKIGYILRYYWVRILGGIFILVVLISIIGRFTWNREKEKCLGVGFHSVNLNLEVTDSIDQDFAKAFPEMTEEGKKVFKIYPFFSNYNDATGMDQMNLLYKIVGSIELKEPDVMIGDRATLEGDCPNEYFKDLREIFSEEELKKIDEAAKKLDPEAGEGVVYVTYSVMGDNGRVEKVAENIPLLIRIEGANEAIDQSISVDPAYISVIVNTEQEENTRQFIFSLLGIE